MVSNLFVPPRTLTWMADAYVVSGRYARAIVAYFGRRPRNTWEGHVLAHVPELYHVEQRVNGKAAQLESY